ncbi:hypothetical protein GJAV_G00058490 [Gymnothorax javanicus]|nr:hypothetical protein GJAV_G00058490 [Gymnothorax javanicus]
MRPFNDRRRWEVFYPEEPRDELLHEAQHVAALGLFGHTQEAEIGGATSILKVKRRDFTAASVTNTAVVCSAHFKDEDYVPGDLLESRMGFQSQNRVRLIAGAVPSIHTGLSPPSAAAASGLGKPLDAAAKDSECEDLKLWRPAIINHLCWTAASTPNGDPDVMAAKWQSMVNHIQDIHEHDTPAFPKCAHPPLEGEARNKEWLEPVRPIKEKQSYAYASALLESLIEAYSRSPQALREQCHLVHHCTCPTFQVLPKDHQG